MHNLEIIKKNRPFQDEKISNKVNEIEIAEYYEILDL